MPAPRPPLPLLLVEGALGLGKIRVVSPCTVKLVAAVCRGPTLCLHPGLVTALSITRSLDLQQTASPSSTYGWTLPPYSKQDNN